MLSWYIAKASAPPTITTEHLYTRVSENGDYVFKSIEEHWIFLWVDCELSCKKFTFVYMEMMPGTAFRVYKKLCRMVHMYVL